MPNQMKETLQEELPFRSRGGKRRGAGRTRRGPRRGVSHRQRPGLSRRHPVHVTLRVVPEVGRLRRRSCYRVVREALVTSRERQLDRFRVCHVSIQGNHLHLLVEAEDRQALSRGMQGLAISCAKGINRTLSERTGVRRRGRVFADRYHAEILEHPQRVRHCLAYVLNNWRRHREDVEHRWRVDPFSSGRTFNGWADATTPWVQIRDGEELLMVWFPRTWLLAESWKRHGSISPWERPGPK